MTGEKLFESLVKRFLKDEGCWFVKYWAGAAYTKAGVPDLLVCCNGFFVAVEVKSEGGAPSELQLWNIGRIKAAGGVALTLRPDGFDEFKALIRGLKGKEAPSAAI
jgi:hypothetical protein